MHFYWTFLDIQEGMGLEKIRGIKYYWRLDPSTRYRSLMLSLLTGNPLPPPHPLTKTIPLQKPWRDMGWVEDMCFQKTIPLVYFSIYTDTNLK